MFRPSVLKLFSLRRSIWMASGSVCGVAMFRCFQKADGANDIAREIWLLFTGAVLRVLRSSVVGLRDSELAIFTRKSKDAMVCSLKIHETVKLTFPRQWYVTATRKRFFLKESWIFYRNLHRKRTFNCRGAWTSPNKVLSVYYELLLRSIL